MSAYLVRLINTHDLVGLYSASDLESLRNLVNECTDTYACEYREIVDGGVFWEGPAIPVPLPDACDDDDDAEELVSLPWETATETDGWLIEFFDEGPKWLSLMESDNDN